MNKQRKDILLNTAAILAITAILKLFIQETMMMWFFLFLLQELVTKFTFASPTKTEQGMFIDIRSGISIKHSFKHLKIPNTVFFLMVFSVITGFIIADKFKGFLSEILQILCLLLPFIVTRSYLFMKKLPLSFLYIFFYHQYRRNLITVQKPPIYKITTQVTPFLEENFLDKMTKSNNDWYYFYSPNSYVRRYMNDE